MPHNGVILQPKHGHILPIARVRYFSFVYVLFRYRRQKRPG
jgi:hypothetical protein